MEATFDRDRLIERILADVILLRARVTVLEAAVEALYKHHLPDADVGALLKSHLQSSYAEVLSSYPEINEAFQKKLKDELGL